MSEPCSSGPPGASKWLAVFTLALLAAPLVLNGCASMATPTLPWQKVTFSEKPGDYKSAEISYRIDAGRLSLPMSVARIEGRRVSFDEIVSKPEAGSASGGLTIRYPHPDGRTDVALARLEIQNDPRTPAARWKPSNWLKSSSDASESLVCFESWQLDISKADLDQLVEQLRRDGCLTEEKPQATGSTLTVGLDGRRVTKPWSQLPALEATMQRVRVDGQLLALHRPATPAGKTSMTSSLVSYRNLVQEGGGGDSPQALALATSGLLVPSRPAQATGAPMLDPAAPPTAIAAATNGPSPAGQAQIGAYTVFQSQPEQAASGQAPGGTASYFGPAPATAALARAPGDVR